MITLQVNKGQVTVGASGAITKLLTETGIGFGHTLYKVLETCPSEDIKQMLIKRVFELVLEVMKDMEAEEE